VDHHPGRFVHQDQITIFEYDIERDILRNKLAPYWRMRKHDRDRIPGLYTVIGPDPGTVYQDIPRVCCRLDPASGGLLQLVEEEFINPEWSLTRIDRKTEMFKKVVIVGDLACHL
jgi:hypothetical protein